MLRMLGPTTSSQTAVMHAATTWPPPREEQLQHCSHALVVLSMARHRSMPDSSLSSAWHVRHAPQELDVLDLKELAAKRDALAERLLSVNTSGRPSMSDTVQQRYHAQSDLLRRSDPSCIVCSE